MLEKPGKEKKKMLDIELYLHIVEHTSPCHRQGYCCVEKVGSCQENDQHCGWVPSESLVTEEDIESDDVQDTSNTGYDDGSCSTNKKTARA
jgi:hypothetical protein